MRIDAPSFWWRRPGWQSLLLAPLAGLYGAIAARRLRRVAPEAPMPVICVGNYTLGGSGKTPLAIALAAIARKAGLKPGFISRGHGGSLRTSRIIDAQSETAQTAGDEPMLLARHAPVAVGVDRRAACALLAEAGCTLAIMDDGFQSRRLAADMSVLAVDAGRGIGNGRVFPAGPLRAPLGPQVTLTDMLVVIGEGDGADPVIRAVARAGRPVVRAVLKPRNARQFKGRKLLAFAGLGHPGKFFATLAATGAQIVASRAFPDHHAYTPSDISVLQAEAETAGATLATTAKDAVRLKGATGHGLAPEELVVLEVDLVPEAGGALERLVESAVARHRNRR